MGNLKGLRFRVYGLAAEVAGLRVFSVFGFNARDLGGSGISKFRVQAFRLWPASQK